LQANPDLLIANINRPDDRSYFFRVAPGKPLPSQAKASSFIQGRDELLQGANFNLGRATYGPLAKGWVIPLRYAIRNKEGELLYVLVAVCPCHGNKVSGMTCLCRQIPHLDCSVMMRI